MKEAQKLIEDTINMIDEYEKKIDQINRENDKRGRLFAIIMFVAILIGLIFFFIIFN